ncbi:MAG: 2-C-methyl-D-erythritol 2,4-cyclodiphosphate synthase [bacterium]
MTKQRIGIGYDVHALVEDRQLILAGQQIPHDKGLMGHSDADVLCHAIMDACLGALSLGDIGDHFPDTDTAYKDADSLTLLAQVNTLIGQKNYHIQNLDTVIMAQAPKLSPYKAAMIENLARCLSLSVQDISVKITTTERLGFVGREEGIAAQAVVLLHET